jgi:uncharacterized LabA/DUF88 family protein
MSKWERARQRKARQKRTQRPEALGPESKLSGVKVLSDAKHIDGESQQKVATNGNPEGTENKGVPIRVHCFIDGFNLYHALQWFEDGVDDADHRRYRKYKWASLKTLANCYISPKSQVLVGVSLFTTYTHWDSSKMLRHRQFVMAQESEGVQVTFGKFKQKFVECEAICKSRFPIWQEKQTDVNIAIRMTDLARQNAYDKALIISGDSDLIPAIKLIHRTYPEKQVAVVVPIGRKGEEIEAACNHQKFTMTEDHLKRSHMADKLKHPSGAWVMKPYVYD